MTWTWFDHKKNDSDEWTGFLDQGVKIEGKLETTGTFRIDSAMKGTLASDEMLIIGDHATVEGQILGNCVIIAGRFDGSIHAKGKVEILPNGVVTGEIYAPCLLIEPGAIFDGRCYMTAPNDEFRPVVIPIRSAGRT